MKLHIKKLEEGLTMVINTSYGCDNVWNESVETRLREIMCETVFADFYKMGMNSLRV